MAESNAQLNKFNLITGATSYRSRSDITATPVNHLVSGSQNVLINEATDKEGDLVETRAGYELFGVSSTDRNKIKSEFKFKTKAGNTIMGRMDSNGDLEYYSEESSAWETLLTGLDGSFPLRWTTVWNGTELLRILLFVNHSSIIYEWTGAFGTYASSTSNTIVINETIATEGFFATGASGDKIRVKDSGGTWREFTVDSHSGSTFTVSGDDPTNYTFTSGAIVVQSVRSNANKPASGFTNDTIAVLQNHVFVGSNSSSIVYMSQSDDYVDFTFSSPRVPTEGWQFILDEFNIGFKTNIGGTGDESLVMFAGNDWIYRVEFQIIGDTSVIETVNVKPIFVSEGQGAISQELISKVRNSIVFINGDNELVDLGQFEDFSTLTQIPISDPVRPDFVAANFTDGAIRFFKNNLYVTAPASGKMFIFAFRENNKRFWQPPQTLPVGQMTDYGGDLIGHSNAVTESYKLFTGTNDNTKPVSFKAHFAYSNSGSREKLKNFDKYFTEMYVSSNAVITHKLVYEYLGAKQIQQYTYFGTSTDFLFTPNLLASLGVNSLGTSPLGGSPSEPTNLQKYRRFKKVAPVDHYEFQVRYESDELDTQFKILCHGANPVLSRNAPQKQSQ